MAGPINVIADDTLRQILGYSSLPALLNQKCVCKKWKRIIEGRHFLAQRFPVLRFDDAPLHHPRAIVKLANCYAAPTLPYDLGKLKFNNCPTLNTETLKTLNARIQAVSIMNRAIISNEGIGHLVGRLSGEVEIQVGKGSQIDIAELFSCLLQQKVRIKKIEVNHSQKVIFDLFTCYYKNLDKVKDTFCSLIENDRMSSPCHISLHEEPWMTNQVLESLVKKQVGLSYIGFTCNRKHTYFSEFIDKANFISPCEIDTNFRMDQAFLQKIIHRKIQLKKVVLDDWILNNDVVLQFFENCVASPCTLTLNPYYLGTELVEIILRKQIVIESLTFIPFLWKKTNIGSSWQKLFSQAIIKKFQWEDMFLDDQMLSCFPTIPVNLPPIQSLTIKNSHNFRNEQFFEIMKSPLIAGENFSLSIQGDWIFHVTIAALDKNNLKFKKLEIIGMLFTITSLILNGSLNRCETLLLGAGCDESDVSCLLLSSRNEVLRKLRFSLKKDGLMKKILLNTALFPILSSIIFNEFLESEKDFYLQLQKVRPNLAIEFIEGKAIYQEALE